MISFTETRGYVYHAEVFDDIRSALRIPQRGLLLNRDIRNAILSELYYSPTNDDVPGDLLQYYDEWSRSPSGILIFPAVLHQLVGDYLGPLAVADPDATDRQRVEFQQELERVSTLAPMLRILDVPLRRQYLAIMDADSNYESDEEHDDTTHQLCPPPSFSSNLNLQIYGENDACDHETRIVMELYDDPMSFPVPNRKHVSMRDAVHLAMTRLPAIQDRLRVWFDRPEIASLIHAHRTTWFDSDPITLKDDARLASAFALLPLVPLSVPSSATC